MNKRFTQSLALVTIILFSLLLVALTLIGAPHLLVVPRQYLFKLAVLNTIGLAIPTTAVVVLLGTVGARWLQRFSRGWQIVQLVPLAVLSVALLVPGVITAVRRSLQPMLLDSPINGLVAIGVVYVLILLPVAIWLSIFNPLLISPSLGEGLSRDLPSGATAPEQFPPQAKRFWGGLGWGQNVANPKTEPRQSNPLLTSPSLGEGPSRDNPTDPKAPDQSPPQAKRFWGGLGWGKNAANPTTLPQQNNPLLTSPSLGEGLSRGDQFSDISEQAVRPVSVPSLSEAFQGRAREGSQHGQPDNNAKRRTPLSSCHPVILSFLFILLNPITPLLLTGGEPYNRTHLWASWAFTNAYVGHSYGQAAAMIVWMLPLILGIGFIAWLNARRRTSTPQ